jgi:hypothetical protein
MNRENRAQPLAGDHGISGSKPGFGGFQQTPETGHFGHLAYTE